MPARLKPLAPTANEAACSRYSRVPLASESSLSHPHQLGAKQQRAAIGRQRPHPLNVALGIEDDPRARQEGHGRLHHRRRREADDVERVALEAQHCRVGREGGERGAVLMHEAELVATDAQGVEEQVAPVVAHQDGFGPRVVEESGRVELVVRHGVRDSDGTGTARSLGRGDAQSLRRKRAEKFKAAIVPFWQLGAAPFPLFVYQHSAACTACLAVELCRRRWAHAGR
eukprot:scaffold109052_cov60-Phaeocystis_antarctica.AAC.1